MLVVTYSRLDAQVSAYPYLESFDSTFTSGYAVQFLPNWWGNVVRPDTLFRETSHVHTGAGALYMIPQEEEFRTIARVALDFTGHNMMVAQFWLATDTNGGGQKHIKLSLQTSVDGGLTYPYKVSVGPHPGFPNAHTPYSLYELPFHPAAANQPDVRFQLVGKTGGHSGAPGKLLFDDFHVYEVLVDSFPPEPGEAAIINLSTIILPFSEPLDISAENTSNYTFLNGSPLPQVISAVRTPSLDSVVLTLNPPMDMGIYYELALNGIADTSGNVMLPDTLELVHNSLTSGLVITEVMYDEPPVEQNDYLEFIELYNASTEPIPLGGLRFKGAISSGQLPSYSLQPGEYWVIAKDSAAFHSFFGFPVAEWKGGNLSNDEPELIILENSRHHSGEVVDSITYTVGLPWPAGAAGLGHSMELCDAFSNNSNPANWTDSNTFVGLYGGDSIWATPGQPCGGSVASNLMLGSDSLYCGVDTMLLDAGNPGAHYRWSNGSDGRYLEVTQSGTYSVVVNNGMGASFDTIQVTLAPEVTAGMQLPPTTICQGDTCAFVDASAGASGWLWNLGDGSLVTQQHPNHVYGAAGAYMVTLICSNSFGCTDTATQTLSISGITALQVLPAVACSGAPLSFDGNAIGAVAWFWEFGDGDTALVQSPVHSYATAGSYTVSLTAENADGCTDSVGSLLTVAPAIIGSYTASPSILCAGSPTLFTGTTAGASFWWWEFGDGSSSPSPSPYHTYINPGTYPVNLVVESTAGCKDTVGGIVNVGERAVALIQLPSQPLCTYVPGTFVNLSTGTTIWQWSFGDGSSSSLQAPTHTYSLPGTFNVSLLASNTDGCQDSITLPLNVEVCTALAEFSLSSAVAIYPNPAPNGSFKVAVNLQEYAPLHIMIADLQGRVVNEVTLDPVRQWTETFSLGHVAKGMYLVEVRAGNQISRKHILID